MGLQGFNEFFLLCVNDVNYMLNVSPISTTVEFCLTSDFVQSYSRLGQV